MKKQILLFFAVIFLSSQGFSQFKLGVKGGLNYNFAGNITEAGSSNVFSSENKAGFHLGLWSRFSIVGFGLRPEIVYTELKSQYQLSSRTTLKTKKIDSPVLFDQKLGPLHVFAGPAFQLILNPWILIALTVLSCYLLNAEIPLFSLKFKTKSFKSNSIRYVFLLLSVVLLVSFWFVAIPMVIFLYVVLSVLFKGKK